TQLSSSPSFLVTRLDQEDCMYLAIWKDGCSTLKERKITRIDTADFTALESYLTGKDPSQKSHFLAITQKVAKYGKKIFRWIAYAVLFVPCIFSGLVLRSVTWLKTR